MIRAILILFIASGLAGCKSQTPTVDPFFGRTTVPPPPTGSVSPRTADPYYQPTTPLQPIPQTNVPNNNAPGISSTNPTNTPPYAGPSWTNPSSPPNRPNWTNPSYPQQFSSGGSSALSGSAPSTLPGASGYPYNQMPQGSPALNSQPGGYGSPTPAAQPASNPSTNPGTSWPGGNRYAPPSGSNNYRGSTTGIQNYQPGSTSPNRVSTPYFAGGTPNRRTLPVTNNNPSPMTDGSGYAAGANANNYSNQNGTNLPPIYSPTGTASSGNSISAGQSPVVQTIQPQPSYNSQGYNYVLPASRRSSPTPALSANNAPQPTWRESTSTDTELIEEKSELYKKWK